MQYVDKKRLVLEYIRLGVDFYDAALAHGCGDDEIDALSKDPEFERCVKVAGVEREAILLTKLNEAMDLNIAKGVSVEARWMLEKMYPVKYGTKITQVTERPDLPAPVVEEKQ
jgi:hypothetical protein